MGRNHLQEEARVNQSLARARAGIVSVVALGVILNTPQALGQG
jgi:hypothetical protein